MNLGLKKPLCSAGARAPYLAWQAWLAKPLKILVITIFNRGSCAAAVLVGISKGYHQGTFLKSSHKAMKTIEFSIL